jgi:hypothetical protein
VSCPPARGNFPAYKPKKGDPAVIEGDFVTYRHVQGRSVMQAVIEFPIERQDEFFAVLGYPVPSRGIRVAIVRLTKSARPATSSSGLKPPSIALDKAEERQKGNSTGCVGSIPIRAGQADQNPALEPVRAAVPRGEESPPSPTHPSRASLPERTAAKAELMRHLYASLSPEDRAVRDAGMLAKDAAFMRWLAERYPGSVFGEDETARYIRSFCQVESRTEIAANAEARERFLELKAKFEKESGRLAEVRG